jgi:UDP-glucose 4-epimerase
VLEAVQTFEEVNGVKVPFVIGPRRAGDVVAMYADTTKSREVLGWSTERTLADALRDAWRWQLTL